jgi:integrase
LIEQGLIELIEKLPDGFIFADPTRRRSKAGNATMHKKTGENLGRWVRSLGLTDPELQPNHGWRHRFKTMARRVGMDPGARDYLQGHTEHNEAEAYGDQPAPVLLKQLALIPFFDTGVP